MPKGNRTKGRKPNSGNKNVPFVKQGIPPETIEKFCRSFVSGKENKAQAARDAGYSKGCAGTVASRLLKREDVKELIAKLRKEMADRFEITADKLAQEYASVAFADMKDFVESGNEIVDVSNLDNLKSKVVQSVKKTVTVFEGGTKTVVEIKLHSKIAALEALGRHVGLFEVDNKQKTVKIKVGYGE